MPWCEECARYFAPSAMNADGSCPRCGRDVESTRPRRREPGAAGEADEVTAVPWHFKLLLVALVVYLGWRFVQLVMAIVT